MASESNFETASSRKAPHPEVPRRPRWGLIFALAMLAVAAGLWSLRRPIPRVTRAEWERARQRWSEREPANYRIQVRVTGKQGARYDVLVRDGKVTEALRNNQPLSAGRTMATWSVPGMFGTILLDLEGLERAARGPAESQRPSLLLRCQFHPEWSYPERYQRIEWGAGSTNPDVTWTVDRFEVLPP